MAPHHMSTRLVHPFHLPGSETSLGERIFESFSRHGSPGVARAADIVHVRLARVGPAGREGGVEGGRARLA